MNLNPIIGKLLSVVEPEGTVVTLTLDLSKSGILPPATRLFLKRQVEGNLLSRARREADREQLRKLYRKIWTLAEKDVRPETDGLYLVAGRTVWEAVELRVPLRNFVTVGRTPYLAPLLEAAIRSPRATLVHMTPGEARIEELHLGELRALATLQGEGALPGIPRARSTGYAGRGNSGRDRAQRREGEHVHALLREAASWVARANDVSPVGTIYLVGRKEYLKAFTAALPPALQGEVVHGGSEVKKARGVPAAVLRDLRRRAEAKVEEESLRFEKERRRGLRTTQGPGQTFEELSQGFVGRVYLDSEDPVPGVACAACHAAFPGLKERCPVCDGDLYPTSLTQEVVSRALRHPPLGLTFVPPGSAWLADLDGMAALRTARSARRMEATAVAR